MGLLEQIIFFRAYASARRTIATTSVKNMPQGRIYDLAMEVDFLVAEARIAEDRESDA